MTKYQEVYESIQASIQKDPHASVAGLCKKLGVSPTLYYYGMRKIKGKNGQSPVRAPQTVQASVRAKTPPKDKEVVASGVAAGSLGKRFLLMAVSEEQLRKLLP